VLPEDQTDFLNISIITQVPRIMRNQKPSWEKAALLQEKWFKSSAKTFPDCQYPEFDLITMDWLLSYPVVKDAYNELLKKATNEKSLIELKTETLPKLIKNEFYDSLPTAIDDYDEYTLSDPKNLILSIKSGYVPKFDFYYYNFCKFTSEEFNDLTGALHSAVLRVFVNKIKITKKDTALFQCEVLEVGIYMRDSFDFIEDTSIVKSAIGLGYWNPVTNFIGLGFNPINGKKINNVDYRNYRTKTGFGGDFLIFSNFCTHAVSLLFDLTIE
jgi:hypothetical protein